MKKLKIVSILFKIFGALCLVTALVISLQIWNFGRQFGYQSQAVSMSIMAVLNFSGSVVISSLFFYVGKLISERRRFAFCKGISIFICFFFPLGTALGVYSVTVLNEQKNVFK